MAERRMFAKTIIDSDAFLDMPLTTQALYFHLSMRADDEGFINNPKKIMRMIGASDDEFRLLQAKSFIIPFDSGVCVIKHWRIHNYLRNDRFKPTVYVEEKSQLSVKDNRAYTLNPGQVNLGIPVGIPNADQMETQYRLGKVSVVEDSIEEYRGEEFSEEPPDDERPAPPPTHTPYEQIKNLYNEICKSLSKCTAMSEARKKCIRARFSSGYKMEDFKRLFEKAEASSFMRGANSRNWRASFDWLITDSNMAKVLDGNYDDHISTPAQVHPGYQQPQQPNNRQMGNSGVDRLMAQITGGAFDE
jgi:uncharacterized phage protein (TIGR02220 family)